MNSAICNSCAFVGIYTSDGTINENNDAGNPILSLLQFFQYNLRNLNLRCPYNLMNINLHCLYNLMNLNLQFLYNFMNLNLHCLYNLMNLNLFVSHNYLYFLFPHQMCLI